MIEPLSVYPIQGQAISADLQSRFRGAFPDPYCDYASTQTPRSIYDVLRWSEFTWMIDGTYRMASRRVVRYFLTKLEFTDASDDEKKKYNDYLEDTMKIMRILALLGDNFICYGNVFVSLHVPFRRYLKCPKCNLERPIGNVNYGWSDYSFTAECKCGYRGQHTRVDRRSVEADPPKVVFWPPQEMRVLYNVLTGDSAYFWQIPGYVRDYIQRGNKHYLEGTPWEVIEAVKQNKLFRFNDDVIFHMRDDSIAGLRHFGWGIPMIMANFKLAWSIQVLKRYNQAIALDYIIPFRVVTPHPGNSRESDPVLHVNLGSFNANVAAMMRRHRLDPTQINFLPFPIDFQMLGAEGKNLAPVELIDKTTDELLNAQGIPAELYRGTLQVQAMPTALRLFERTWTHLVSGMNEFLDWFCKQISEIRNWENLHARLQPTTLAEDIERRQIQLQLAAGSQISRQTAWAPFGIEYREEVKRMLEENAFAQREQQRFQQEQQQQALMEDTVYQISSGQAPAGNDPNAQAQAQQQGQPVQQGQAGQQQAAPVQQAGIQILQPAAGTTPEDMLAQAEQIAGQLLNMPYEQRRVEMTKIKRGNETLHSLVLSKMDQIRQRAQTLGGYQMIPQLTGAAQ